MPVILLPPMYAELVGPVVFLAGPIQGAPLWQPEAAKLLHELMPELHVANPRRDYIPGEFEYDAQVDWETHHLRRAATAGSSCSGWRRRRRTPANGPTPRPPGSNWPSGRCGTTETGRSWWSALKRGSPGRSTSAGGSPRTAPPCRCASPSARRARWRCGCSADRRRTTVCACAQQRPSRR